MLYSEIIAVCSEIHTKHINTLWAERPAQKTHSVSVIKTNQLMLYSEIIAVSSQIHTKHKYTVWVERTAQ
jgi:ectoine hydroxylase-related dioxygenase (phytanoyl-CoA dioxygenase family)